MAGGSSRQGLEKILERMGKMGWSYAPSAAPTVTEKREKRMVVAEKRTVITEKRMVRVFSACQTWLTQAGNNARAGVL
jgi:hypothetical protein